MELLKYMHYYMDPKTGSMIHLVSKVDTDCWGKCWLVEMTDPGQRAIMVPMHNAALNDGCTLVIRGTKRADMKRLPAEDGPTGLGYDLWLPLLDWSDEDVFAYLREVGAPICRVYENGVQSPECATCPAWWSEGRAAYLAKHHPALSETYRAKLEVVAAEVAPLWAHLQREIAG